jgi:hypothetical protein
LSLSLMFPHQHPVCISPIPHTCYMHRPSHCSWFDYLFRSTDNEAALYIVLSTPSPVTSSLLCPSISSAPYSQRLSVNVPPQYDRPSFTPI